MNKFNELYESVMKESFGSMYYFVEFDKNHLPIGLYGSKRIDLVWYKAIHELGGMPVDTDGNKVDSLEAIKRMVNKSPNKIASLTMDTANYRTNKEWYAIMHTNKKIKLSKDFKILG